MGFCFSSTTSHRSAVSDSDSNYLIQMENVDKSQAKGNYGIEKSPFLQGPEQAMASGHPSRLLSLQDLLDPSHQLSVGNSLVLTLPFTLLGGLEN